MIWDHPDQPALEIGDSIIGEQFDPALDHLVSGGMSLEERIAGTETAVPTACRRARRNVAMMVGDLLTFD